MASANDVARYILARQGRMSAMKLHKLLYYSQAWSLVWDDAPLFDDRIEAWANGPVVRSLYAIHRGHFAIDGDGTVAPRVRIEGDPEALTKEQMATVDAVLGFYGNKDSQWLSDLTHSEDPWRIARGDTPPGDRSDNEITQEMMAEYYSNLPAE